MAQFASVDKAGVLLDMKTQVLAGALLSIVALYLSGCADQPSTTAAANPDPGTTTVTRTDLNRTTRTDAAGAIQAADPSVGRGR
jgi:PBP1b-binding outer membrane lipoprotein LpoB